MFCLEIIHKELCKTTQKELMHPSPSVTLHKTIVQGDFPGWPVVKNPCFHCRGEGAWV